MYRLNVLTRAFEAAGGRNVAAQNNVIVSDAAYLVGVKPDGNLNFVKRGTPRTANWLAVDQQLNPVPAGTLTLEWVERKYVSVLTQQDDGTLRYVSKLRETVRDSRSWTLPRAERRCRCRQIRARRFSDGASRCERRQAEFDWLHSGR